MKFGIFYEHQLPRPWTEGSERVLYQNALDRCELPDPNYSFPSIPLGMADRMGNDQFYSMLEDVGKKIAHGDPSVAEGLG